MLYNCIMSLPAYKSITFLKRAASTRTEPKQCGTTAASTPPCEPEDLYRAACLSALYARRTQMSSAAWGKAVLEFLKVVFSNMNKSNM